MAAVPITISGVLCDKYGRTIMPCTIVGDATLTGVGVGGGPLPGGPGEGPPGIWGGGNVPMPNPPIANVPGAPGYQPPGIWGGPIDPYPGHPLPEPPGKPTEPPPDGADKPPPESGGWGFVSEWSQWGYFPGETAAQPK